MTFDNMVASVTSYFPKAIVKYKDQSLFMRILGKLLFFAPEFMTTYSTTINNTIYMPSQAFIKSHPISAQVMLMHEIVHLYDKKRLSTFLFMISYLLPQLLAPFILLLLFVLSWKIVLPLSILFLLPIPAYFRMYYEKRAYIASLYVVYLLGKQEKFDPKLPLQEQTFLDCVHGSTYYFAWPFTDINAQFDEALVKINNAQRPFDDNNLFDMLEKLINNS